MARATIDFREYPMHRPLPTHELSRSVILLALGQAETLIWSQMRRYPDVPYIAADYHFLIQNRHPFLTEGGRGWMSWHHAMNDTRNNLSITVPRHGQFKVPLSSESGVPIWLTGITDAYNLEIFDVASKYQRRKKKMPPGIKAKVTELRWKRDLFRKHGIPAEGAINEQNPYWEKMRDLAAYAFHEHVKFQPYLSEEEAKARDTREALMRMHGPVLILP